MKIKKGTLIKCKYKWGNKYLEGIGYIHKAHDYYIGISCKDGGVMNLLLNEAKDIQILDL